MWLNLSQNENNSFAEDTMNIEEIIFVDDSEESKGRWEESQRKEYYRMIIKVMIWMLYIENFDPHSTCSSLFQRVSILVIC